MAEASHGRRGKGKASSGAAGDLRPLSRDIHLLRSELKQVLQGHGSADLLRSWARLGRLAARRRRGEASAGREIRDSLAGLGLDELHELIRVEGCYLELVNLAEDHHQVRVWRQREEMSYPAPRAESIGAAIDALAAMGWTAARVQGLLDRLEVCPVFTAHPTEAKRATVRRVLARLREDLRAIDRQGMLRREREESFSRLRSHLVCLWETDTARSRRPTVLEEVQRGLFVADTLWEIVPELFRDLRAALRRNFGGQEFHIPRFLQFGSWIGGDRDGNPNVTAEITRQTLELLRSEVLQRHLDACRQLASLLTVSDRYHPIGTALGEAIQRARQRWPEIDQIDPAVSACSPCEPYRFWLAVIRRRLEATVAASRGESPDDAAYRSSDELLGDVELIAANLHETGHETLAEGAVQEWLDRIAALGFHFAALDIREESTRLGAAVAEMMAQAGLAADFAALSEQEKQALLLAVPSPDAIRRLNRDALSPAARETVDLFRLLARTSARFGRRPLGALIVSMTHRPSDVFAMLWLCRVGATSENVDGLALPIAPLFETIDDLHRADDILRQMLEQPAYRAHVQALGGNQVCMIGYSDSVKDGGYLAANWNLYDAQRRLAALADRFGVTITFFHGRGGALGRGGGPAARAVLSLPPDSLRGRLRLTEQGEVVAERYSDPWTARRHLEQLTWATVLVSADIHPQADDARTDPLRAAADAGYRTYRRLLEDPGFPTFFRQATPIDVIESLPIGSRPSRRGDRLRLEGLRAIPYTFAWTQCRLLLTGYFGLGSGLASLANDGAVLRAMYAAWPFFRTLIDNAELALAKSEPELFRQYAAMAEDSAAAQRLLGLIEAEYGATRQAVLHITERSEVADTTEGLRRSMAVRNPHLDLLNFVQIELLKRRKRLLDQQADGAEVEPLDDLLRASVQAISTGMRTTG